MRKFVTISLFALSVASQATAQGVDETDHETVYIALPTELTSNIEPALVAAEQTVKQLNHGDRFVALNSSDGVVLTTIDICPDKPCSSERKVIREHRADFGKAFGTWSGARTNKVVDPTTVDSRLISTIKLIGDMQAGSGKAAHALVVASPIHVDKDPIASMLRQDGMLYLPSSKAFSAPATDKIYGQGGREATLNNVNITFCATLPEWVREPDHEKLKSTWATYVQEGGGLLVGYFADMEACADAFARRPTTPISFTPLDAYEDTSMTTVAPIVTDIEDFGSVTDREVKITVHDVNNALDDAYSVYVNNKYIGDVANIEGGKSAFPAKLNGGDNIVELRVKQDRGNGTYMRLSIEPGGFKKVFAGTKTHTYKITAPKHAPDAMIPVDSGK